MIGTVIDVEGIFGIQRKKSMCLLKLKRFKNTHYLKITKEIPVVSGNYTEIGISDSRGVFYVVRRTGNIYTSISNVSKSYTKIKLVP